MLIKLPEWLERNNNLKRQHIGIVKANNDTKGLGRVKVKIPGLFNEKDSPWVYPRSPYFLGGSDDSHILSIPEVGSEIIIVFPYDDIYAPEYIGKYNTTPTKVSILEEDYPNTYGFKDSTGTYIRVNKTTHVMEIHHTSNTHIKITADGDIEITNPGDRKINTNGDTVINTQGNTSINTSGETDISSDGELTITAPMIRMN